MKTRKNGTQRFTSTHATMPETATRAASSTKALTSTNRAYWVGGLYLVRRVSKSVVKGETTSR